MQKNKSRKTEIVIVLDRSGSMDTMVTDMEPNLKSFLKEQKAQDGVCKVTLYKFDNVVEKVLENQDISLVDEIKIEPRGATALYDAVGRAINEVGTRLDKTKKSERPDLVLMLVITDGYENSSREFSGAKVKEMVKHQEEKYKWEFVFLGAGLPENVGEGYGFDTNKSISYRPMNVGLIFSGVSCQTSSLRAGGQSSYNFTPDDKAKAMSDKKPNGWTSTTY
jgi:uncharacterized protein YegL